MRVKRGKGGNFGFLCGGGHAFAATLAAPNPHVSLHNFCFLFVFSQVQNKIDAFGSSFCSLRMSGG